MLLRTFMCHSRNTIKKFSHREEPQAHSAWRDVAIQVFKILSASVYVEKFKIHGLPRRYAPRNDIGNIHCLIKRGHYASSY
jgi:hypothetical protein